MCKFCVIGACFRPLALNLFVAMQCMSAMYTKNGPSLSLGEQLCRGKQPEILCIIHSKCNSIPIARARNRK